VSRNCLLGHPVGEKIEGRTEVTGKRRRRRPQLLNDLKEKTGYWILKATALWRIRFGRGYGTIVKTDSKMNE
jgi:hypothetical protein